MNEVEKVRHRAYALEARGWLLCERGGVFRAAPGPAGALAAPAGAAAGASGGSSYPPPTGLNGNVAGTAVTGQSHNPGNVVDVHATSWVSSRD